ncbi:MAG: aromatic ring-hydroxylating dioxygenase subunit alpha [Solirubrobacterales bacterium]|nr:aromatic ring-hydroxylating dioxygenase subunit alpha [Solirubrobacterales bacterium]HMT04559.1 aromatic ring-hydroxylating dioxygenase subunit alpha [Solirubrobacterales bacterium]
MSKANGNKNEFASLPLNADDVARSLRPLEAASMLPPAAFVDQEVFDWEMKNLFLGGWICLGHISQVAEQGRFIRREMGPDSIVVVGGEHGQPHAFLNVCRHRGARVVVEPEGKVKRRLQCPYHAWSYALDGSLVAAPHMDEIEDFDKSCFGLIPVRMAVLGGLILVDLSGEAPEPDDHVGELIEHLDRYRTADLVSGGRAEYDVAANWKGIAENYNECLHCPGVHPELNALSDYQSGEYIQGEGSWCGGSMVLTAEDAATMGKEGGHAGNRSRIEGLSEEDDRTILYFALFPNALVSMHPDYVMLHTLYPRGPGRTEVICEWFFERRAVEAGDFDPTDAIEFWDQTNRQDWDICQLAQLGVATTGYTAGRYSDQEGTVHEFDSLVAGRYMEALEGRVET